MPVMIHSKIAAAATSLFIVVGQSAPSIASSDTVHLKTGEILAGGKLSYRSGLLSFALKDGRTVDFFSETITGFVIDRPILIMLAETGQIEATKITDEGGELFVETRKLGRLQVSRNDLIQTAELAQPFQLVQGDTVQARGLPGRNQVAQATPGSSAPSDTPQSTGNPTNNPRSGNTNSAEAQQESAAPGQTPTETSSRDPRRIALADTTVIVKKRQLDLGVGANYTSNARLFGDRVKQYTSTLTASYGLFEGGELFGSAPGSYTTNTATVASQDRDVGDTDRYWRFGNPNIGIRYEAVKETDDYPSLFVGVGVGIPLYEAGDPRIDPRGLAAQGLWTPNATLGFSKSYDPLVIFGSVQVTEPLERRIPRSRNRERQLAEIELSEGREPSNDRRRDRLDQGIGVIANLGWSFALNDRISISNSIIAGFQDGLKVNGRELEQSDSDPVSFETSLTLLHSSRQYLIGTVDFGLNRFAPDFVFGLRYVFQDVLR